MSVLQSVKSSSKNELNYPELQKFITVKWPSDSDDVHYSIFCDNLPEDIINKAMQEVNETEENKATGVQSLKKFMRKKGLICSDDEVLISVLRNCKYDIKKSESKLEKYLKFRQLMGSRLAGIDIKDLEAFMDNLGAGVLPYRDPHGRIICFTRPIENLTSYETDFASNFLLANLLFCLSLPMASLLGITYIGEADFTSVLIWHTTAKVFKNLLLHLKNIPLRIRRVEVLNGLRFVRWCYAVLRPMLPAKIANRVSFLGEGYGNLHKHYHPDILPNEFGGNLGPLNDKHYRKKFLDFVEKFKAEHDDVNL